MKAYWDSLTKEQQGELAGKVGSTPGYLRLVFNGYKKASFVLAKKLEQCTSGAITKSDLRPDIRAVLPETLRMLLQVTHGSAFCSQQASYVRVGVWLTVVKEIHTDISSA